MEKDKKVNVAASGIAPPKRVIRLEDLDGEEEIVGGAGQKLFFGEQPESASPFAGLFGGGGKNTPASGPGK